MSPIFNVLGKLQPRNAGNTVTLGALTGSGQLAGPQSNASTGDTLFNIGGKNLDTLFSGVISSNSAVAPSLVHVNKVGSGTLTLTGNNTYTGTNNIAAGTLLITGNNTPAQVTVAGGATFGGSGTNNGPVTVNSGGVLMPGVNGCGPLTINGNLTNNATTLHFDLSGSPAGANDRINLTGTLALSGAQNFIFNLVDGALGAGTYGLIEGANNFIFSGVSFTTNLPGTTRQTFAISTPAAGSNPSYVRLNVSGSAATLVWSATNGGAWDPATTVNWFNAGAPDVFYNLDTARFTDASANGMVTIAGTVQPITVVVSNATRAYTIGGGAIAGFGSLVKQGSGALTLSSSNAYTGGSTLNSGALTVGQYQAPGSGLLTLNGGTLAFGASVKPGNSIFVTSNTTVTAGSLGGFGGVVTGGGNLTLTVSGSGNTFDISGDLSSYGGTLTVNSSSCYIRFNYSNNSIVDNSGASIDLGSGSAQLLYRNAGSFTFGGLSGGPNTKLSGASSYAYPTYYFIGANNGSPTFNGSITDNLGFTSLTKVGSGTLTLGSASTGTADMDVTAGTLRVMNAGGSATGLGNSLEVFSGATLTGTVIVGSATTVDDFATLAPGNPTGTLTFTNNLTLSDNSVLQFGLGSDAVLVNGDLFLTGQLIVSNAGGFGTGVYPLFTSTGTLTFDNLVLASAPAGYNYSFNTNTPGVVKLVVAPTTPPKFGGVNWSGGNLTFTGTNGVPLGSYAVLTSTNVALPKANWTWLATNKFDAIGGFAFTNSVASNPACGFFQLQLL